MIAITRPKRKRLFTLICGAVVFAALYGIWVPSMPSKFKWRVEGGSMGATAIVEARGITGWLVTEEARLRLRDEAGRIQTTRSTHVAPFGLIVALMLSSFVVIVGSEMKKGLVKSTFRMPTGRCDFCGYTLQGLSEARCPECGEGFG